MSAPAALPVAPAEPFGPTEFARAANVSRETMARLKTYAGMLSDWNARHNLVSEKSLGDVWRRHFWDSAQLAPMIPNTAKTLTDLGSGAGFPGLVLAALFPDQLRVELFEATAKKAKFLEAVVARLGVTTRVRNERIEEAGRRRFDVITARACAPLPKLLGYAQHFAGPDTVLLFLKGQNVGAELTEAHKSWKMKVWQHQSLSDPSGVVLEIRELAHAN